MAEREFLDTVGHADVRVRPPLAAERHFAQVVPQEFGAVAARCPIVFTKHVETGAFYAGALMGFARGENLLVDAAGTFDGAMPLDLEREGFFIVGENIAIDSEHPRFRGGEGAHLFEQGGTPSLGLRKVQRALALLKSGLEESDALIRALMSASLIEPIDIALTFDDGEKIVLEGLYTVSRDALHDLDDAAELRLFRAGHLQHAFTVAESLHQIPLLARRRNDRLAGL